MISVIIPVYNCEKYIDSILESLWNQTYQDFEVICVNDGSTDGTLHQLQRQKQNHEKLKIVTTPNSGPSSARNTGMDNACGEYICFIDSDDQIENCYLMDLYETAQRYRTDISICHIERIYEKKPSLIERRFHHIQNPVFEGACSIEQNKSLLVHLLNAPFAKLIRRDFIERHHLRFLVGRIAQDFLFTKSMLVLGATVSLCPKVNYHYQIREGSVTTGRLDKALDLAYVFDELMKLCTQQNMTEKYHDELEYLCLYHLGIDMSYRLFKASRNAFRSIQQSRKIVHKYGFHANNPYLSELNLFSRLYLLLFFS